MNSYPKARKPIVIANWKLNGGLKLICTSFASLTDQTISAEVVICPPNVYLRDLMSFVKDSGIKIGSQNVSKFATGAFTGETSAQMLKEAGCEICLIGHSERRSFFFETNGDCQIKIQAALKKKLLPVLCIGEKYGDRLTGNTMNVINNQLKECLSGIDLTDNELCVAYEPVWAIGTGLSATPENVQEIHASIRKTLTEICGEEAALKIRVLYGGSVTKENAASLLNQPDIDGLLVGGASLDPNHFLEICNCASMFCQKQSDTDKKQSKL